MASYLALAFGLTFVIHLISTLSYAVRIVGVRTRRIALSFALFNILVLFSRTANTFQAPLLAKGLEQDLLSNRVHAAAGQFRWLLVSAAVATLLGAFPSFVCVECRRSFPQDDVVWLNRSWVCAQCKPMFVQRLKEGIAPAGAGVWRYNRQIVMQSETPLPDRCIRCNAPANGFRLKRQFYWHPPAFYLLIIISILIYVIVALCIRKKALIHIGLCETHRTQRQRFITGSWLAMLVGLGMLIAGMAGYGGALSVVGIILLLAGAIFGVVKGAVVSAAKIDKTLVWVRGAGLGFLTDLPEWNGPQ